MESRESQRDKRVQDVINGRPSGGGDSPTASAMRAREEIQGIEAERSSNLERQKILGQTRQAQMATMKQAALLGASGMAAADTPAQQSVLATQAASMNPQTQAILQKYGVKPGRPQTTSSTQVVQSGPNIRTTNTTTTNTRNEIKIVQPQIPMRQQAIPVASQGKGGNLDKFKAWLDNSFAKQATEYEVQQKEYRKREWNLARNSSKLFQKLSESTKSLGEKMDPRNMGSTFGGQLKTLLFLFLATTISKWWNPLMEKVASFEAGFRAVFGLPVNADLQKGGASGYSFVNKIKEFIGIDTKTDKGKATSLIGGIREVFSDGINRLIDTLKLFVEDRRIALQKINLPEFNVPKADLNPLAGLIGSAFKGVMGPATEYLGNIFAALTGGSNAVVRKAASKVDDNSKDLFKHAYGGRYFTSNSTDWMGNLKDDSTYGMSEMLTRNLTSKDNVLRTGSLMTGLKMLEGNAQKSGGAVINPELLARLGVGPDVISRLIQSGQAQYVPYKIIMVPKSSAESEEYSGGSWGSYVGNELLDNLTFGLYGYATGKGAKMAGKYAKKKIGRGLVTKGLGRVASKAGPWGMALGAGLSVGEGTYEYLQANKGNSSVVAKAVPESDPRPGTPIRLLRITPEGFNTIKSQHGIKSFDATDRNFRTWLEGQERNQKAIMGVKGKLVYEDTEGMDALDKGQTMAAAYNDAYDKIWSRPGAWNTFSGNMRATGAAVTNWVGSKINVMASGVSGNPSYARRNTIQNLYQSLKAALDEKRHDLPEDKREAFARIIAAQAMVESGGKYPGGISKLAYEANNYGGVIAPGGKGVGGRPAYYLDNGSISQWTKFKDMQDWANYQVDLVGGKRYGALDLDPSDYVHALKTGGYFGDGDEAKYAAGVQGQLRNVNGVVGNYQYTSFTPTAAMTDATTAPTGAISLGADMSGNNITGCSPESVKDEKLKNILRSRNTGKFYSTSRGWLLLGFNNYRSLCTAGPSTFYEAGGVGNIRGSWWNTGSPYTATSTRIGVTGLKKIWNGSLGQLDGMGVAQLRPGDIGILFGKHKDGSPSAHGMMWDGKHWVSDTVQSHGACYSSGRLGDQSAQIWRMPGFWPDDFGGGDESEAGTTYMDSNGEIYTGTFLGQAGNVAGEVLGTMGSTLQGVAQSMMNPDQVVQGYNPGSLSASQKATVEWMKKNGALEDASGLYLEDKETKTRAYLDPNSGISKTGNITRANIMAIAHMGENGTVDSYEMDQEAMDLYKDRAIGKLLNVAISEGKTPGSKVVDIYLGEFTDFGSFSERAKRYLAYTGNKTFRYNLYEVLADGTGASSILCPRIPLIDKDGRPVKINKQDQFSGNDLGQIKETYYVENGYSRRVGWTYLFKKAGFKYKLLMSDFNETVSDFHPYLYNELKIGITPEATRRINALMAFIRGELENPKESVSWMNDGFGLSADDLKKFEDIHSKILEVGKDKAREALGVTDDKIAKSIEDWKAGRNKDNYVTYTNDDGSSYVIDSTLGIKIAEAEAAGKPMTELSVYKVNQQTGEDYTKYLRQSDIVRGVGQTDFESLYNSYMSDDIHDLSEADVKREFLKRMYGREGEPVTVKGGRQWRTIVDNYGKIRYKRDIEATKVAEELGDYLEKAKEVLGTDNTDEIRRRFSEGLTADEFNKVIGYFARTEGPKWDNLEDVQRYYARFGDVSGIWKGSKTNIALQKSWLTENSDQRKLADALIAKYNERGGADTEDLYNSNGTLVYQDKAGMVHALGKVETNETGVNIASSYGNTTEGAGLYANANEALVNLNMGTQAGQALLESEYASKYGAKSLGGGRMMIERDGERIVFNVNTVGRHASINDIINSKDAQFFRNRRDEDEQNQVADELFGNDSGWSQIVNKSVTLKGGMAGELTTTYTKDSDLGARTHLREAMEEAYNKFKNSDEAKKRADFQEAYNMATIGLSQERLNKIESGTDTEKLEGHAGNIEDYTKRSADYLELIAGAVVEDEGDKKKLDDYKSLALPESQLERRAFGPVTKEDVNKVTEEVQKNSKDYFVKLLVPEMQKLAQQYKDDTSRTTKSIFEEAKKNVLGQVGQNSEGKMFGFGGWSAGIITKARRKEEETKAKTTEAQANNVKNEALNIKAKQGIQKVETTNLKAQTDLTKQETENQKTFKDASVKLDEGATAMKEAATSISQIVREPDHWFPKMPGMLGGFGGGDQKVIYTQEGSNVTINVFADQPNANRFIGGKT